MPVFSQNQFLQMLVGKTPVAITTGGFSTLNDGEIGVFSPSGTRLTEATAATATEFVLAQGRASGDVMLISPVIKKANLISAQCTRKVTSAAAEQVDYIGYNGSANSLDVINSNTYYVRLHLDQAKTSNHGGIYVKRGVYVSDATGTTQEDVAKGITENLIKSFSREPERMIKFERVCSNAGVATSGGTAAVVYGSKYISIVESAGAAADAGKYNADAATIVAGDYIRIGGTATTVGVYKVVSITGGGTAEATIELDIPYQGATDSAVAAASMEVITEALAAAANFGIKLTGMELTWKLGAIHYRKAKWQLYLEDFGATVVTNSVASAPGVGVYEQMAEAEWFYQGNEGPIYRNTVPTFVPRALITDQAYDQIILTVEDEHSNLVGNTKARKQILLAIPNSTPAYAQTGTADDLTDVLEVLCFGSANGNFTQKN